MTDPFPMMFHPTLVVDDLDESTEWFRRVLGRREVRWEEKWDLTLLNSSYPINYSYFFVLGDVSLDVLAPSLLVLPGDREAVYPRGEGLVDIAWYDDDVSAVASRLERNGFRTRDQEGHIILNGEVPASNVVPDCPMIWSLPEDSGLTYEFYRMGERHRPKYSERADPRLNPAWVPGRVAAGDPLGIVSSAYHTVLTVDPFRAVHLFVDVLGGRIVDKRYDKDLDADAVLIEYGKSVLRFATPRSAPILDVLTGEPTESDQYYGITFTTVDVDAAAAHLRANDVDLVEVPGGIATVPATSKGASFGFISEGFASADSTEKGGRR